VTGVQTCALPISMKAVAKGEVKGHEKRMHGMKAGGPTSMDRKMMGRNMARVKNQRGK
jgi:hypothetical protein